MVTWRGSMTPSRLVAGSALFSSDVGSIDMFALGLAVVAFIGLWRYRWNVLAVVGGSALAGLLTRLVNF